MKTILWLGLLFIHAAAYGQTAPAAGPVQKGFTFDTNTLLIIFAVFLLIPVWVLSNTFIASARRYYTDKMKSGARVLIPLGLVMTSSGLLAQGAAANTTPGLSANAMTILLLCVIGAELLLILFFAHKTNDFIQKIGSKGVVRPTRERDLFARIRDAWTSMTFRPIEEEHKLDTGHNYDGIRELDNVIPPWFTTAFLLTIVFAIGYLYRYHIAKSAPMQIEEYERAVALAELKHDEYLKTAASNIDESNVAVMTGADLEAGQKTFTTLCAVCHKTDGGGLVGPNLTDDYWIHGGSLQDIFKTVKYGVPDKGMISWKEQLSPVQMAQVSNYIMTLKGTNPPDAKEKQGVLYVPAAATPADTSAAAGAKTDTLTQQ